jgi:hypothetical protein
MALSAFSQTFWVAATLVRTHALPAAVSQEPSAVQATGHALAATQAFPAEPKLQQSWPTSMSQSWSVEQSRLHELWQTPVVALEPLVPPVLLGPLPPDPGWTLPPNPGWTLPPNPGRALPPDPGWPASLV